MKLKIVKRFEFSQD